MFGLSEFWELLVIQVFHVHNKAGEGIRLTCVW